MVNAKIEILDFSNSQIVLFHTGRAKIQDGNFKLIHTINIDQYERFVTDIEPVLNLPEVRHYSFSSHLSYELKQIQEFIRNLKPRKIKRSLDFIGSTWKWIAGNPDHEDFLTIKAKINNVLENSNKQVIINQIYNDRINNITRITNEIQKMIKENNKINYDMIITGKGRIKKYQPRNTLGKIRCHKLNNLVKNRNQIGHRHNG